MKTSKRKLWILKNPDLTSTVESLFTLIFKTNSSKTLWCTSTNLTPQIAGQEKTSLFSFENSSSFKKTLEQSKISSSTKRWKTSSCFTTLSNIIFSFLSIYPNFTWELGPPEKPKKPETSISKMSWPKFFKQLINSAQLTMNLFWDPSQWNISQLTNCSKYSKKRIKHLSQPQCKI